MARWNYAREDGPIVLAEDRKRLRYYEDVLGLPLTSLLPRIIHEWLNMRDCYRTRREELQRFDEVQ